MRDDEFEWHDEKAKANLAAHRVSFEAAAPRVPQVSQIRRALRLSQRDFAAHYHIPIGTLRDWEQDRKEPDAAAKAYLHVIASEPEVVRRALARRHRRTEESHAALLRSRGG